MRILRLIFLLVFPLALAACGDATGPEQRIVGGWARMLEQSRTAEHLFFGTAGDFRQEIGLTSDVLGPDDETYWFEAEGEYRVRGERLELRVTRESEWRVGSPPRVTELPGTWEDAGTAVVFIDRLVRTYYNSPPDAAVQTRATYQRIPHERLEILD
jgi:hypothetical protein